MAATRTQRLRRAAAGEREGVIRPDRSRIIAHLENGYTIRQLHLASDFRRESHMMVNCCSKYVYEDVPDEQPFSMQDRTELKVDQRQLVLISLRDADNLPHATAWMLPGRYVYSCLGKDSKPLSKKRDAQMRAWCESEAMAYHGELDGMQLIQLTIDALQAQLDGVGIEEVEPAPDLIPCPGHARRVDPFAQAQRDARGLFRQLTVVQRNEPTEAGCDELTKLIDHVQAVMDALDERGLTPTIRATLDVLGQNALEVCERLYTARQSVEEGHTLMQAATVECLRADAAEREMAQGAA
jgi:hypothetical protein